MPVRLDPFQNIVNVSWGRALIGILSADIQWQGKSQYPDVPTLTGFPFGGNPFQVFATLAYPPPGVSYTNPITGEILAKNYLWSKPPFIDESSETEVTDTVVVDKGRYYVSTPAGVIVSHDGSFLGDGAVVFANGTVTHIQPFGFNIPFVLPDDYPAGVDNQLAELAARLGVSNAALYLAQILASHSETTTTTTFFSNKRALIFLNMSKIKALIAPQTNFNFRMTFGGADSRSFYRWSTFFGVWSGRDFPSDMQNTPQWLTSPVNAAAYTEQVIDASPEQEIDPQRVDFTVEFGIVPALTTVSSVKTHVT